MKDSTFKKYCLVIDEWFVNGFNGVKAYQKFYPKSASNTADSKFRRVVEIGRIQQYIKAKRDKLADDLDITLKRQLFELEELKNLSKNSHKYRDAISALREQNRMLGFYELDNSQKTFTVADLLLMPPEDRNLRIIELRKQLNEESKPKNKKR